MSPEEHIKTCQPIATLLPCSCHLPAMLLSSSCHLPAIDSDILSSNHAHLVCDAQTSPVCPVLFFLLLTLRGVTDRKTSHHYNLSYTYFSAISIDLLVIGRVIYIFFFYFFLNFSFEKWLSNFYIGS